MSLIPLPFNKWLEAHREVTFSCITDYLLLKIKILYTAGHAVDVIIAVTCNRVADDVKLIRK
jgi:hypothetical protein